VGFTEAAVKAAPNTPFTIKVQMDNAPEATTGIAPLHLRWDASKLQLNDIAAGELLTRGGVAVATNTTERPGDAVVTLTRPPGAASVSGSGVLAMLSFTPMDAGTSKVSVTEADIANAQNRPAAAMPGDVTVTVK
jgi:hypothetical protein